MTPLKSLRLAGLALAALVLSQCASQVSPEFKAGLKKLVVASNAGQKVTRYKVGLTVFGNAEASPIETPELHSEVRKMMEAEITPRFPSVVFAPEEPPHIPQSMFQKQPDTKAWAMELGKRYQADAVLIISGYWGYPYGMPSYMTAEGMGIWHSGKTAVIKNHTHIFLMDPKTGKYHGQGFRVYGGSQLKGMPDLKNVSDYTPEDRSRLIKAAVEELRLDLKTALDARGF